MMFASGTVFASLRHKRLFFYIVFPKAINYNMHMNVAAFIVTVCMGTDKGLMSGKILFCIFQSQLLCLFSGQAIFRHIFRIKAKDVVVGLDFVVFLVFMIFFV